MYKKPLTVQQQMVRTIPVLVVAIAATVFLPSIYTQYFGIDNSSAQEQSPIVVTIDSSNVTATKKLTVTGTVHSSTSRTIAAVVANSDISFQQTYPVFLQRDKTFSFTVNVPKTGVEYSVTFYNSYADYLTHDLTNSFPNRRAANALYLEKIRVRTTPSKVTFSTKANNVSTTQVVYDSQMVVRGTPSLKSKIIVVTGRVIVTPVDSYGKRVIPSRGLPILTISQVETSYTKSYGVKKDAAVDPSVDYLKYEIDTPPTAGTYQLMLRTTDTNKLITINGQLQMPLVVVP